MSRFILFLVLFSIASWSVAQEAQIPNYSTKSELAGIKDMIRPPAAGITTPPSSPVRTMAEWEEIQGLLITWTQFPGILSQIVEHAQLETTVYIVCSDSNSVKSYLSSQGITPTNVEFLIEPYNSIWSRDYAQWSVYTNDVDSLLLVDWIYNRNRPSDNVIPQAVSDFTGFPLYEMTQAPNDLVHTGGNFMVDGMGTGFSSNLVLDENWNGQFNITNKTETEIDNLMLNWMGIDRYIKMTNLPYDLIHHIDMHMKLLDEETILVGEYPAGVADGPQIEANLQYVLSNFNSAFGTPYKVIRVPMPPENGQYPNSGGDYRTYTNAVFVNKTLLVPTYEELYDTTALRILEEALPGYNVVGINSNAIIPLSGAIHCITKAIGTDDPMLIIHQPIAGTFTPADQFQVDARIQHRSGILSANVHYSLDPAGPFTSVPMTFTSSSTHTWSAVIPPQPENSTVYYYIDGTSNSGKNQKRPMPAPAGHWKFDIGTAPVGIEPIAGNPELLDIYPNPASAITVIPVNCPASTTGTIAMYDMYGKKIKTIHEGTIRAGAQNFFLHAGNFAGGVYVVRIETPDYRSSQVLMIR